MKLLLDEMHAPAAAVGLRRLGHDVVAVKERPELVGLADADLLRAAAADRRAIVTENVKDFVALHLTGTASGRSHAGLLFTHPRRFPRGAGDHVHTLVNALVEFLSEQAAVFGDAESFIWWLDRARQ